MHAAHEAEERYDFGRNEPTHNAERSMSICPRGRPRGRVTEGGFGVDIHRVSSAAARVRRSWSGHVIAWTSLDSLRAREREAGPCGPEVGLHGACVERRYSMCVRKLGMALEWGCTPEVQISNH
jgi:hypothetical protein